VPAALIAGVGEEDGKCGWLSMPSGAGPASGAMLGSRMAQAKANLEINSHGPANPRKPVNKLLVS
jgi:hypothetical protein